MFFLIKKSPLKIQLFTHQLQFSKKMLNYQTQQKYLNQLLKRPSNAVCADCNCVSPTWASLDFGVFLCSNCSGAHRAMGPTVTRVKSTKLDKWNTEWFAPMQIGNRELNKYWEAKLTAHTKKPKLGSSLQQINRYVVDKYLKKKYAADGIDPLTELKNNNYKTKQTTEHSHEQKIPVRKSSSTSNKQSKQIPKTQENSKKHQNLLDFDHVVLDKTKSEGIDDLSQNKRNKAIQDEQDQFGSYTDATVHSNQHFPNEISFDQLFQKGGHNVSTHSQGKDVHHNWSNNPQNKLINQYGLHQMTNNQHHHNNQNFNYFHGYQNHMNFSNLHHNNSSYNQPLSSHPQYHSLNGNSSYQQSNFQGLNHMHHYHTQNVMGINTGLPINAKFPGQFHAITLTTTHTPKKQEVQQQKAQSSWVNQWK